MFSARRYLRTALLVLGATGRPERAVCVTFACPGAFIIDVCLLQATRVKQSHRSAAKHTSNSDSVVPCLVGPKGPLDQFLLRARSRDPWSARRSGSVASHTGCTIMSSKPSLHTSPLKPRKPSSAARALERFWLLQALRVGFTYPHCSHLLCHHLDLTLAEAVRYMRCRRMQGTAGRTCTDEGNRRARGRMEMRRDSSGRRR